MPEHNQASWTNGVYPCSELGIAQVCTYPQNSRGRISAETYVRPVVRFTPARNAVISSASKPRCTADKRVDAEPGAESERAQTEFAKHGVESKEEGTLAKGCDDWLT